MNDELLIIVIHEETVIKYAQNAREAGLTEWYAPQRGINGSKAYGIDFITVTPGIRFEDKSDDDQVRIATPALLQGRCDYIVVGGP